MSTHITDEAIEAAARVMYAQDSQQQDMGDFSLEVYEHDAREILEAAMPHMLSHERQQTADAHRDAMVNRETKRAELAAAWEDGHLMGWNEATANNLPERDSLWRNPYRSTK